jgi:hypothetical protein
MVSDMSDQVDSGAGGKNKSFNRMVMDHPRQLVDGALLVVMVGFLAAMLGLPHLDGPLHRTLYAFAFAMVCFVWSFSCLAEFWTYGPWAIPAQSDFVLARAVSGLVADSFGELAFAVGFASIIAHLSPNGLDLIRNAFLALLAMVVIIVTASGFVHSLRNRAQRVRQATPNQPQPAERLTTP